MENTQQRNKTPLIIGIVAAVLIVIALLALVVLSSPKVMLKRLIDNTPEAFMNFVEGGKEEQPLFMTESHQSETKISMDGDVIDMDGKLEAELKTGYLNSTGDLALELEVGIGDMDAITGGLFLKESEIALISSILTEKYVVDLESEAELGKNTTLEQRIRTLLIGEDEELEELKQRAQDKSEELKKVLISYLKNPTVKNGREEIELFGKDQKVAYVEVILEEDDFKDWAEAVLEVVAEDDELEDLIVDIAEYLNKNVIMDEYSKIDTDEIDLEESCEEAIDELDDFEGDLSLKIYRKLATPIAYYINVDAEEEVEALLLMHRVGDEMQVALYADDGSDELVYDIYVDGENYASFKFEVDDMKYELVSEKKRNVTTIEGEFDYGDMGGKGAIEGEIVENRNETTFDLTMEMDVDGIETEVKYEGAIVTDNAITTTEFDADIVIEGEDAMKMKLEAETEEVRKNKEYVTEGEMTMTDVYMETEYKIDFENTTIFGEEAEVDLPSWSKSDVYAQVSDEEEMAELLNTLAEDFETGLTEIISMIMFGGLY